ncbi:hypothetical protein V1478_008959 [Vespula squamosa]|uniref:Uncharacterized protein n=1 Tax=Vespula squamosa TaxID=30214 RepID=A0ABD2AVN1_VESSQ
MTFLTALQRSVSSFSRHVGHADFRVVSPSIHCCMGLQMQQPPRGETWVGSTCDVSKSKF